MSQSALMSPQKKLLKHRGLECDPFERFDTDVFNPPKHGRPRTRAYAGADIIRKPRPVLARKPVMFDVVAIIKERHVVEETIVTRGASSVLKVSVQRTQTKTERISGKINEQEETRNRVQQESPQCQYGAKLKGNGRRNAGCFDARCDEPDAGPARQSAESPAAD